MALTRHYERAIDSWSWYSLHHGLPLIHMVEAKTLAMINGNDGHAVADLRAYCCQLGPSFTTTRRERYTRHDQSGRERTFPVHAHELHAL